MKYFHKNFAKAALLGFVVVSQVQSAHAGSCVLIQKAGDCSSVPFNEYLKGLLSQLMPLVLFIALALITFSGVQYMTGGLQGDATKKAKQRILGVLGGVIFFLLIGLILNLIEPGLVLPK